MLITATSSKPTRSFVPESTGICGCKCEEKGTRVKVKRLHRVTYDILGVLGAVFGFFRGDKNSAGKTHVLGHQSHPVPRLLLQIPFLEAAVYYLLRQRATSSPQKR